MGKVKEHFHDEIERRATREAHGDAFPNDDLETLRIDMEQSRERYLAAVLKHEKESHESR